MVSSGDDNLLFQTTGRLIPLVKALFSLVDSGASQALGGARPRRILPQNLVDGHWRIIGRSTYGTFFLPLNSSFFVDLAAKDWQPFGRPNLIYYH